MDNEKIIVDALRNRTISSTPRAARKASVKAKKLRASKRKRQKLEKVSTIQNRLMRLWINRIADIYDHKCKICKDTVKPNAHHIVNRDISPALRFDPNNGILLCASHHKFGLKSAHKNGVWFAEYLKTFAKEQYDYILEHTEDIINIRDREVLYKLEERLTAPITQEERAFHGIKDEPKGVIGCTHTP